MAVRFNVTCKWAEVSKHYVFAKYIVYNLEYLNLFVSIKVTKINKAVLFDPIDICM